MAAGAGPGETTLGVDTLVALGVEIYGKPPTAEAARAALEQLSGRTHRVISGVAVLHDDGTVRAAHCVTLVTFRALGAATLDWYVASGEWEGRAGGYAIQGRAAALIERIEGDYLNVVGLPVATLLDLLPDLLGTGD
jgi:septum formation protein